MAKFDKKDKKGGQSAPKAAVKSAQPKTPKPYVPPDIYTLFLGLSVLFLIIAATVLGFNYFYWYPSVDSAFFPMSWAEK